MPEFIKVERANGQSTIWLNRPPLNVLNIPMIEEMIYAIKEIGSDPQTRLLLLRGEGRCFSAGVDVADHLPDHFQTMLRKMHQLLSCLAGVRIPTISVIHGSALGGGLELAVLADFAYAHMGCKIGLPEIKLGVFPPFAVAYFADLIGPRNASDLILSGRTILPEEAVQMGLINAAFNPDDFESRLEEVCATLLSHSKAALVSTKKALHNSAAFESLKAAENIYVNELMQTEDSIEGLKAFLEKREPKWKHK